MYIIDGKGRLGELHYALPNHATDAGSGCVVNVMREKAVGRIFSMEAESSLPPLHRSLPCLCDRVNLPSLVRACSSYHFLTISSYHHHPPSIPIQVSSILFRSFQVMDLSPTIRVNSQQPFSSSNAKTSFLGAAFPHVLLHR